MPSIKESGNLEEEVAAFLWESGVDIEEEAGLTPLHLVAKAGETALARRLLEQGADVHARGRHGDTPLHFAALSGVQELVRLLLEHGADANLRTENMPDTPLDTAVEFGAGEEITALLREYGAVHGL